ncbi:MAG TPA: hypothetical protein VIG94_04750 [Faecalibacter sp.]
MNEINPFEQLEEIKSMMQKTTKFSSINGWSGIWVGIIGLVASYLVYSIILESSFQWHGLAPDESRDAKLAFMLIITLIVACSGGVYFIAKKSKRNGESFINSVTKRILIRFLTILGIGGLVCGLLYYHLSFVYVAPSTLLFYGLALLYIERDTIKELKYLAFVEIILGLLAFYFIYNGLLFWTIGFGIVHLFFGVFLVNKYKDKP